MVETAISAPVELIAQADRVLFVGLSTGKIKTTNKALEDHFVVETLALARASGEASANVA